MVENINRYQQARRFLVQELGREPMAEEVAAEMGEDIDKVIYYHDFTRNYFARNNYW